MDVVALVNDTTGTQMALGLSDPDCFVGLILGTGTNACYMERMDKVPKFPADERGSYEHVIINTEWGAFGEHGHLDKYITEFDEALDADTENKKQQPYEKLISGKYLGEVVRQVCLALVKMGALFGGKSSKTFDSRDSFETRFVSEIEAGDRSDLSQTRKILIGLGIPDPSDEDCRTVRRACEAVSTRAARLAAAGVVSLVRKIGKVAKCTVAVDGSLYMLHPHFKSRMKAAIDEMEPGNGITMKESTDGSGRGAAMVAAVATRLKK